MQQNIQQQLKKLSAITPREDWVQANKELLLAQIKAQGEPKPVRFFNYLYLGKLIFPVRFLNFLAKPAGAALLIIAILAGSGALTVSASEKSMPGDLLYPVKLTSEKVQVGLASSADKKTELHVGNAEKRVQEIEQIIRVETEPVKKKQMIMQASNELKKSLAGAQNSLEKVKTQKIDKDKEQQSLEVVKKVDTTVEDLSKRLADNENQLNGDQEVVQELKDAAKAADDTSAKAVEVMVEKREAGQTDITDQEVAQAVEKQLIKVENKLQQVKQDAEIIKAAKELADQTAAADEPVESTEAVVEPASEVPADVDSAPAVQADPSTGDVTVPADPTSSEPATEPPPPVPAPEEIQVKLDKAQELLKQGDLKNAMILIKETEQMTKQIRDSLGDLPTKSIPETMAPAEAAPAAEEPAAGEPVPEPEAGGGETDL